MLLFVVKGDLYVHKKNSLNSVTFLGIFICRMASIRSGSRCTPSASKTRLIDTIEAMVSKILLGKHFTGLDLLMIL